MENQFNINEIVAEAKKMKDKNGDLALTRFALFFLLLYKNKAEDIIDWERAYNYIISCAEHSQVPMYKDFNASLMSEDFQKFENMLLELAKTDFKTALEFLAFDAEPVKINFEIIYFEIIYPTQYAEIFVMRKERKAREQTERVLAFLNENFEKYHNVYKALA